MLRQTRNLWNSEDQLSLIQSEAHRGKYKTMWGQQWGWQYSALFYAVLGIKQCEYSRVLDVICWFVGYTMLSNSLIDNLDEGDDGIIDGVNDDKLILLKIFP